MVNINIDNLVNYYGLPWGYFRLKEFEHFSFTSTTKIINFSIANTKYVSTLNFSIFNIKNNTKKFIS